MERRSVEAIARALNEADVRYLVVGGVAVAAYGFPRFTNDVDLIIDLEEENLRRALRAFSILGYRPKVPVPIEQFADQNAREQWIREKGMVVFSLWSDSHRNTPVDIFVQAPFDFGPAYARRTVVESSPGLPIPLVGLADLVYLKRKAGRPKDMADLEVLELRQRELEGDQEAQSEST